MKEYKNQLVGRGEVRAGVVHQHDPHLPMGGHPWPLCHGRQSAQVIQMEARKDARVA